VTHRLPRLSQAKLIHISFPILVCTTKTLEFCKMHVAYVGGIIFENLSLLTFYALSAVK